MIGINKVFIFSPQKTAVKMTGCLPHFHGKGSLFICGIRIKDHVRVLRYIMEYHLYKK